MSDLNQESGVMGDVATPVTRSVEETKPDYKKRPEFQFEILKNYGILAESTKGWKKELNKVSWNNGKAKYDIRDWSPDHKKMGKGLTLNDEEIQLLRDILDGMEL